MAEAIFSVEISSTPPVRCARGSGPCSIDPSGRRASEISYHSLDGAKSKGPSTSIKFEGKPPFYLGIAEIASAHAR